MDIQVEGENNLITNKYFIIFELKFYIEFYGFWKFLVYPKYIK